MIASGQWEVTRYSIAVMLRTKASVRVIKERSIMMNNATNLEFTDISNETYREYVYQDRKKLYIPLPTHLHVNKIGGHRVLNEAGRSYYIAPGWLWIEWEAKEGKPNFAK